MTRLFTPPPGVPLPLRAVEFMLDRGYLAVRAGGQERRLWRGGEAHSVADAWAIEVEWQSPAGLMEAVITDQSPIGPTGIVEGLGQ